MDKIDAMLITLLQENARAPLKLLASKVFLSAPAVSSRIDKLEKQGIILGYNTIIDRQKLGYHITAFINLELSADQKAEFYPFISSCPNVLECNCVTGIYSMLIKVSFPSTQELDTFIGKIQRFGRFLLQCTGCKRERSIFDPLAFFYFCDLIFTVFQIFQDFIHFLAVFDRKFFISSIELGR